QGLLAWLEHDNFVLMGLASFALEGLDGESGVDRQAERALEPRTSLGFTTLSVENQREFREQVRRMGASHCELDSWVVTYKSQEESLIHRAGKIDNVIFKHFDDQGRHVGYYHLRGLFTFKAIQTLGGQIPFVRLKLADLLKRAGFNRGSIKWKAFTNAYNSIPVEYLFEAEPDQIAEIVETILYVEQSRELRTHVVVDDERRKGLYFLVLPRQGYSEGLRTRIEDILIEGLGATYSDSRVYFGKFDTVLLTFFFTATQPLKTFARDQLDERVRAVAGTWDDRFHRVLVRLEGDRAADLFAAYRDAFPEDYQLATPPSEAALDVHHLERIRSDDSREVSFAILQNEADQAQSMCRLRVYLRKNVYLSTLLPLLDDFGLQIVDQAAFRVRPKGGRELFTQTFRIAEVDPESPLLLRSAEVLDGLEMVFGRRIDSDPLNRLIVDAGLGWRDVNVIRAYVNYMRQLGVGNTFAFMANTFRQNHEVTKLLMELYRTRFDPSLKVAVEPAETELQARTRVASTVEEELLVALQQVPSQAQDTFLRRLLNLFTSTLRTTRYQGSEDSDQKYRLAIKIDSGALVMGSHPRPWREIFVHHYGTEGIHIRGGRLARGGIRWSDRLSDYREEVLGLMRTQMVKNVLIVPVGAKGGFVVRRPKTDRDERQLQGESMYRVYINALLDITDNVVDGQVVHPEDVVCYDGEDPYLVVAADKGTAHLSDTANSISQERGFWLGDAFASGGRHGYDHKALGITARGAWECVRRHFAELGVDPERDTISAVGIGDMSGDVFGNGMLCSRTIQLKAAFNHLHIFVDPDPDTAASFEERCRLFALPRSTWLDYDRSTLSAGGGIYDRNAKTITLSAEATRMFGFDDPTQRPQDVIRSILKMKVDLLWNGGIGTYIKSAGEDNRDVGDLTNEAVRVDAREVRARVLGEGGNLGVTSQGRIDLALRGVRLNADFVDNSAGVNCSDHEVNLKILLAAEIKAGRLDWEERNELLARLSDDVCLSVLRSNFDQALALSLDAVRSQRDVYSIERVIKSLEDLGVVDRIRDHLPDLEDISSRNIKSQGMTRPELATLNAFTKMEVYRRLLDSPVGAIPDLDDYLISYFPDQLVEFCGERFGEHLLAREISMTVITNLL
ncbi:MAG: NAD-glutamate dehydrogenase, partial [Planctomycetes bacterium]|nr:NAD-glutamate dehydrogenase [Planctomycetota bacterium]